MGLLELTREVEELRATQHTTRRMREVAALYTFADLPIDAVMSLVIPLSTGQAMEIAMVGCDGLVGSSAALNGRVSLNRAIVQVGGVALRCEIEPLKKCLKDHSHIRSLLGAHEQALLAQAQQSAACNVGAPSKAD